MLTRLKSMQSLVIAALVLSVVVPKCVAQGVRPCKNGSCGSPLAGPCVPARVTYGHVETCWRRWPTDHVVAKSKGPEELPTPATRPEIESMPDPGSPATAPPGAREPGGAAAESPGKATDGSLTPPFGDAPTPAFGDEPPAFGDEPQAPPSAADPLAAPFGDEPPTPPSDVPSEAPPTRQQLPAEPGGAATPPTEESTPHLNNDAPPAMPEEDLFKNDPFKDDPEPKTGAAPGTGALSDEKYSSAWSRGAAERSESEATAVQLPASTVGSTTPKSEPRLLQANGENLNPPRLPEPMVEGANPLRQVSHPVRRSAFGAGEGTTETTAGMPGRSKPAVGRHNPLRGN